jgi:hypothetical protein
MITVLGTATTTDVNPFNVTSNSGDCILGVSAQSTGAGRFPTIGPVTCAGVTMNLLATYDNAVNAKVWIYYLRGVGGGTKTIETNLINVNYLQGITAFMVSGLTVGTPEYYGNAGNLDCNFTDADTNGIIITAQSQGITGPQIISLITAGITKVMTVSLTGLAVMGARFKSTSPMGIFSFN